MDGDWVVLQSTKAEEWIEVHEKVKEVTGKIREKKVRQRIAGTYIKV